jgi:biofilm PGA synthesis protein PgaD
MRALSPFIISHPERQSGAQHTMFSALTLSVWVLWLYLWLPLITTILWMVGIRWTYIQVFRGSRGVSLWVILWIMIGTAVILGSWSSYNHRRFAKKTQRRQAQALAKSSIGTSFGISSTMLSVLLRERRLNLYFDDAEQLIRAVAVSDDPSPSAISLVARITP